LVVGREGGEPNFSTPNKSKYGDLKSTRNNGGFYDPMTGGGNPSDSELMNTTATKFRVKKV